MKLRGYLPSGTGLTTEQILMLLTEEMGLYIPALLKGIREEYLVAQLDLDVTDGNITIPERACGAALRLVQWQDDGGDGFHQLARIEPENVHLYETTGTTPVGFVFRGNNLHLIPSVSTGTLRLDYQQRPGQLVLEEDAGLITDIDVGTGEVTISAVPADFAENVDYDFISGQPNFTALALDEECTDITSTVLTFATLPDGLSVGDWVALAGQTPIPQMPYELHYVLAQRVAYKIAESMGSPRAAALAVGLEQAKRDIEALLSPRADGNIRPIVSRYGVGSGRWGW